MSSPTTRSSPPRPLPGRGRIGDEVELARVSGVFGVRGEVRLHVHDREGSFLLDGPTEVVLVGPDGARRAARLTCRPGAGRRVLGRIDGVGDRDAAAALKGTRVVVSRAAFPAPAPGEFYVTDLIGLSVLADDRPVGRLQQVHATAGGDILELRVGGGSVFLPFASADILEFDLAGGVLRVRPEALDDGATG